MSFGTGGGLADLKRAQFAAALSDVDGGAGAGGMQRPKPQVRPSSNRDPVRWFSVMPPPALPAAQKSFRRAAETAVRCANAQAKMDAARRRYEALLKVTT